MCLVVICYLHFWQILRASAVTRGCNGYRNKSRHRKLTLEKILPLLLPDSNRQLFSHESGALPLSYRHSTKLSKVRWLLGLLCWSCCSSIVSLRISYCSCFVLLPCYTYLCCYFCCSCFITLGMLFVFVLLPMRVMLHICLCLVFVAVVCIARVLCCQIVGVLFLSCLMLNTCIVLMFPGCEHLYCFYVA